MFKWVLLVALLLGFATAKVNYRSYKVYKIFPKDDDAVEALVDLENASNDLSRYQFWRGSTKVGQEADLMVAPELQEQFEDFLAEINADVEIMMEDVQDVIDKENPLARSDGPNPVNWTVYNTLDEVC